MRARYGTQRIWFTMRSTVILLTTLVLLSACTSQPQVAKDTPIEYERSFSVDGAEYKIILAGEPRIPWAGEPFSITISVIDKNSKHPPHLTYTLTITDSSGKKLFIDSLHDMNGEPYKKHVTLGSAGGCLLQLRIDFGMGGMKSEPFKGEFGFWVR